MSTKFNTYLGSLSHAKTLHTRRQTLHEWIDQLLNNGELEWANFLKRNADKIAYGADEVLLQAASGEPSTSPVYTELQEVVKHLKNRTCWLCTTPTSSTIPTTTLKGLSIEHLCATNDYVLASTSREVIIFDSRTWIEQDRFSQSVQLLSGSEECAAWITTDNQVFVWRSGGVHLHSKSPEQITKFSVGNNQTTITLAAVDNENVLWTNGDGEWRRCGCLQQEVISLDWVNDRVYCTLTSMEIASWDTRNSHWGERCRVTTGDEIAQVWGVDPVGRLWLTVKSVVRIGGPFDDERIDLALMVIDLPSGQTVGYPWSHTTLQSQWWIGVAPIYGLALGWQDGRYQLGNFDTNQSVEIARWACDYYPKDRAVFANRTIALLTEKKELLLLSMDVPTVPPRRTIERLIPPGTSMVKPQVHRFESLEFACRETLVIGRGRNSGAYAVGWSVNSGLKELQFTRPPAVLSASGNACYELRYESVLRQWDLSSGELVHEVVLGQNKYTHPMGLSVVPLNQGVIVTSGSAGLFIYNPSNQTHAVVGKLPDEILVKVVVLGDRIYTRTFQSRVHYWTRSPDGYQPHILAGVYSKLDQTSHHVVIYGNNSLLCYNESGDRVATLPFPDFPSSCLEIDTDTMWIGSHTTGDVQVWSLRTSTKLGSIKLLPPGDVYMVRISQDVVALSGKSKEVFFVRIGDYEVVGKLPIDRIVTSLYVSNGILYVTTDDEIQQWDCQTMNLIGQHSERLSLPKIVGLFQDRVIALTTTAIAAVDQLPIQKYLITGVSGHCSIVGNSVVSVSGIERWFPWDLETSEVGQKREMVPWANGLLAYNTTRSCCVRYVEFIHRRKKLERWNVETENKQAEYDLPTSLKHAVTEAVFSYDTVWFLADGQLYCWDDTVQSIDLDKHLDLTTLCSLELHNRIIVGSHSGMIFEVDTSTRRIVRTRSVEPDTVAMVRSGSGQDWYVCIGQSRMLLIFSIDSQQPVARWQFDDMPTHCIVSGRANIACAFDTGEISVIRLVK